MEGNPTSGSGVSKMKDDPGSAMSVENDRNHQSGQDGNCGTDVARARWTLLRQVLKQKPLDSEEVQRVSVRRFSSFNLFSRTRLTALEPDDPSDGDWVEYRSASFPQYSALLRDNLGPMRVDEVLNSFDNTGNVCECLHMFARRGEGVRAGGSRSSSSSWQQCAAHQQCSGRLGCICTQDSRSHGVMNKGWAPAASRTGPGVGRCAPRGASGACHQAAPCRPGPAGAPGSPAAISIDIASACYSADSRGPRVLADRKPKADESHTV
ncbi:hypothetical protein COCON_G00225700 [Conger conger]|uniref:Uncharacterized protein n=1 Tax=Conger conger TaxID=82655 RepID=A0A9Q1CX75_CONCO|nr:hypothetical protein COCON_G00225700 [Conger conger]